MGSAQNPDHVRRELARRAEARAEQRVREELLASEHGRIAGALIAGEYGEQELVRAREQVAKWKRDGTCSSWYVKRWSEILFGPPSEVAMRMRGIEAGERRALYQNTPFGFLLSERVRSILQAEAASAGISM
jgi:hypothetical protein